MKKTPVLLSNVSTKSILLVGGGIIAGAVAGTAAVLAYSLFTGKSITAILAAKTTLGGLHSTGISTTPSSTLNVLIPTSLGAIGGAIGSLGIMNKKLKQATDTFTTETNNIRENLQTLETKFTEITDEKLYTVELEKIKGICPKFSHLLQDAGINTIEDLAKTKLETLDNILHTSFYYKI